MSTPNNTFQAPPNSLIEPKKGQNDPLKAKNKKVRKQKSHKMKVNSLYEYNPKNLWDPNPVRKKV